MLDRLRVIFLMMAALVAFPHVHGEWSAWIIEGGSVLLLLLCLWDSQRRQIPFRAAPGTVPLVLLGIVALLQLLPLPPDVLQYVSPKGWELLRDTVWVINPGTPMPISFDPGATFRFIFQIGAGIALLHVVIHLHPDRERLQGTVLFLAVVAGLLALFELGRTILGSTSIGMRESAATAKMVVALFPLVLSLFLIARAQANYLSFKDRIGDIFLRSFRHPPLVLGIALIPTAALLLTGSGIILPAALVGLLVLGTLSLFKKAVRRNGILILTMAAVALFGTILIGQQDFVTPWDGAQKAFARDLHIVSDFAWSGAGLGAVSAVRPGYPSGQDELALMTKRGDIELAAGGGWPAIILGVAFLICLVRGTIPHWRRRHSRRAVGIFNGALAGLFSILIMGGAENIFYFFLLSGMAIAAANKSMSAAAMREDPLPGRSGRLGLAAALTLLLTWFAFQGGEALSRSICPESRWIITSFDRGNPLPEHREHAIAAIRFAPFNFTYRYSLAIAELSLENHGEALEQFGEALRLFPLHGGILTETGLLLGNAGHPEEGEKLLRAAVNVDRISFENRRLLGAWLLARNRHDEGIHHFREAMMLAPLRTRECIRTMVLAGMVEEEIRMVLPEMAIPHVEYGNYLLAVGKESSAEESYRTALHLVRREKEPSALPFWRAYDFYLERGLEEEALEVIQTGIALLPGDAGLRRSAAELFERAGLPYKAQQERRTADFLDPKGKVAR
jgi:tetratricopeptide (TPR) repeat protein